MQAPCATCKVDTEHKRGECIVCAGKRARAALEERRRARKEAALADRRATKVKKKRQRQVKKNKNERARMARKKAAETEEERAARKEWQRAQREMNQTQKAQQEMARREMARRHLLPFIQRMDPGYMAGWFHKDLCLQLEQFLQDVIDGKDPRKMLFVPPRHGKSLTGSRYFPSWALGKYPHLEFMQTSYAESLQLKFAKQVQQTIRSPEYEVLFPGIIIPKNFEAVKDWQLAKIDEHGRERLTGGGMLSAGVGGPLSGRGFHIGTIDDPVKNREEADSAIIRESIKSWYSSTFSTRGAPGSGILIIQTRWHDDDLSGWLLRQMAEAIKEEAENGEWPEDADKWEVISYPAIATENEKYRKRGDALHPERYSLKSLLKKKRSMAPRDWGALYQQNPVAEEGNYFTKDMIRTYSAGDMPPTWKMNIFAAGDLAISKKEDADYSVILVCGLDENERIWILDARHGRWDSDEIVEQIADVQKTWKPVRFGIEREKVKMALESAINRKIRDEKLWSLVIEDLHIGSKDKRVRARPAQGMMKQGRVMWPRGALWLDDAINELLRFDAGVHDDYVDAIAWLCYMLQDETYVDPLRGNSDAKSWRDKLKAHIKGAGHRGGPMAA